jgi:hypothetical protein
MIHHSIFLSPNKTNSDGQAYSSVSYPRTGASVKTNTFPSSANDLTAKMDIHGPYQQSNSYGMRAIPSGNPTINAFTVIIRRKPNASSNLKQQLSTKICLLHNRRSECMPDSTELFHPQLSTFLRNSTSVQLQNWLNLYGPAIIDSIATRQSESVLHTRPLTKYFTTTPSTSTRPRTRHRRTLKPRFNSKVHAPKHTKSKRRLPPVRYTAQITRWLLTDKIIPLIPPLQPPTRATSTTAMARPVKTRGQQCPHQITPGSGPAVQAVRCASQVTFCVTIRSRAD